MQRIKFFGIGGQGAVTAAKVFSEAVSLYAGEYAITVPAYGHERRGAPVFAHIIVDKEPVLLNCYVYEPDIVVVFDESIIDKKIDVSEGCHKDSVLVVNTESSETLKRYTDLFPWKEVYYCNGTGVALKEIGMAIPNSAMLGALAKTGIVTIDAVAKAVEESFGKVGGKNAAAAKSAYEQTVKA